MALWYCRGCTAAYSVGAPACPQCGASDPVSKREDLPRQVAGVQRELAGEPGPAINADTGQVTPAGEPLPEIPAETSPADTEQLEPAPPARKRKVARRG